VEVKPGKQGEYRLGVFGPEGVMSLTARAPSGGSHALDLGAQGAAISFCAREAAGQVQLGVVAYAAGGEEKAMQVQGARMAAGDQLGVRATAGGDEFQIDNPGAEKRVALSYRQTGANRAQAEQRDLVVAANERRTYTPQVDAQGQVSLEVAVDSGRDGTIDRTERLLAQRLEQIPADVPAFISKGRTLVPLRFVREALGAAVAWDADSRTVSVIDGQRRGLLEVP
jgi:hypothetical protein